MSVEWPVHAKHLIRAAKKNTKKLNKKQMKIHSNKSAIELATRLNRLKVIFR